MSTGKLIVGIVSGVALGAVLGILFAPDKGVETRKKIAQKGCDFTDLVKNKFTNTMENISDNYEDIKSNVKNGFNSLTDSAKDTVDNVNSEVRNAFT